MQIINNAFNVLTVLDLVVQQEGHLACKTGHAVDGDL